MSQNFSQIIGYSPFFDATGKPMKKEEIIDIQSRLAFQEDALTELNRVAVRQQQEIRELQKVIKELKEGLKSVAASLPGRGEEEPPPHY
jgi:SlyX protein